MQIGDLGVFSTHAEAVAFVKVKAVGRDEVLGSQSAGFELFPVEVKFLLTFIQQVVHHSQAFCPVQTLGNRAQPAQLTKEVQFDTLQAHFGSFVGIRFNAEDQVLAFDQPVIAFSQLGAEHLGVFTADSVESICLLINIDRSLIVFDTAGMIVEAELYFD